jgi:Ribonuclease G/E
VKREILLAFRPGESWAALVEDSDIVELRRAGDAASGQHGAIYLGRVVGLRPELPAALVDIGLTRPAFLSAEDVRPKGGFAALHEGQAVIVQLAKDARADKAAGLTMRLDRKAPVAPEGAKPPLLLDQATPDSARLVTLWLDPKPDKIRIDERAAYAVLRGWLTQHHANLAGHLGFELEPIFEQLGLGEALDEALSRRVELPGGGALILDETALGIAIDVDSGKAKPLAANLAAAVGIARQIRLRNLAGPMMLGFVGMKGKGERERVLAALRQALAKAAPDCQVLGWTRLGHVEMVRPRAAPSLAEQIALAEAAG